MKPTSDNHENIVPANEDLQLVLGEVHEREQKARRLTPEPDDRQKHTGQITRDVLRDD
jgi:hypothetical protein